MINGLTYDVVKASYDAKGYRFFDDGAYNINIGFIRESDEFTNGLTDTGFIAYRDEKGEKRLFSAPATTKAGFSDAIFKPKAVAGVVGVAVLVPGQYAGTWQFVDSYAGWLQYPYFQQIKDITVYRDFNGDKHIDKVQSQKGKFGINIHRMGNVGMLTKYLGNWSEGCLGYEEPNLKMALPIIRESVKRYGNIFTVTLLEKADIKI